MTAPLRLFTVTDTVTTCPSCASPDTVKAEQPSTIGNHRFFCLGCGETWLMRAAAQCPGCGKPFASNRQHRRYCSKRCVTARGPWSHPTNQGDRKAAS